MKSDFLEFSRYNDDKLTYLIFVSKYFYIDVPNALYDNIFNYKYDVIRNDLGFYPQFHYLEKMTGDTIDDYTISQYDAVCCAAEIDDGKTVKQFKYGKLITDFEWAFHNHRNNETIKYPVSSQSPFAGENTIIKNGYYDVSFNYSLTDGTTHNCTLNSAFRIKNI